MSRSAAELVPSCASHARNFEQSSPSWEAPHLIGLRGALASENVAGRAYHPSW